MPINRLFREGKIEPEEIERLNRAFTFTLHRLHRRIPTRIAFLSYTVGNRPTEPSTIDSCRRIQVAIVPGIAIWFTLGSPPPERHAWKKIARYPGMPRVC